MAHWVGTQRSEVGTQRSEVGTQRSEVGTLGRDTEECSTLGMLGVSAFEYNKMVLIKTLT